MARLADLTPGAVVTVTRGYATRPAVVAGINADGTVHVRFTDVMPEIARSIPVTHRGALFGATVRPAQVKLVVETA